MYDYEIRHGYWGDVMGGASYMSGIFGQITDGSLSQAMNAQIGSTGMIQQYNNYQNAAQNQLNQIAMEQAGEVSSFYQHARTLKLPEKKVTMFSSIKKYFDDHRDILMTLAVLVVVDQWVFDGAFKEKIKLLIDRVIGHADGKIKALEAKK